MNDIPDAPTYTVDEAISSIQITPDIVREKLESLNPNKLHGHDSLHPYCLKELANTICVPLSILFNKKRKQRGNITPQSGQNCIHIITLGHSHMLPK